MDPRSQDKNDAEDAGSADQQAGADEATVVGSHELIRMPRRDAAGRHESGSPRDARANGGPPLVDMTCERLYRQYGMPRARPASRRPPIPWKWIIGAGAGGASIAAAISLGWAVGTATVDDAASQRVLIDTVGALQHKVATLESSVARKPSDKVAAAVSAAQLRAAIAQLETRLEAGAGKTSTKLTQFASQLEKLDAQSARESAAKLSEITERLDRIHHQIAAISAETTGQMSKPEPAAPPLPPVRDASPAPSKAAKPKSAEASSAESKSAESKSAESKSAESKSGEAKSGEARRPLDNWVLRGVHDGTALVEGVHGLREVAPGSILPGAGRVKSIERHGGNWVVITTAGVIDPAN